MSVSRNGKILAFLLLMFIACGILLTPLGFETRASAVLGNPASLPGSASDSAASFSTSSPSFWSSGELELHRFLQRSGQSDPHFFFSRIKRG